MNLTYFGMDLKRMLRDVTNMFFIVVLPAILYVIYARMNPGTDTTLPSGNGNVAMYLMISMATFGAATATITVGGLAGVERMQGWGRQLGLTPMSDAGFVAIKTAVGVFVAALPVVLIFLLGALTGAQATTATWMYSALITMGGSLMFALLGVVVGLALRTEAAVGGAAGGLVVLAFLGNLFFPLSGVLLDIARFTPMYGYAQLARWPLTDGIFTYGTSGTETFQDPLWVPVANLVGWTLIFAVAAVALVGRGRSRQ